MTEWCQYGVGRARLWHCWIVTGSSCGHVVGFFFFFFWTWTEGNICEYWQEKLPAFEWVSVIGVRIGFRKPKLFSIWRNNNKQCFYAKLTSFVSEEHCDNPSNFCGAIMSIEFINNIFALNPCNVFKCDWLSMVLGARQQFIPSRHGCDGALSGCL